MELRQLESFVAVIQHNSFTKAAALLHISQPTISTHITALEEELQYRLIIRTTKSIQITPHGKQLYDCACKMLSLKDNLLDKWKNENENLIRIGTSTIPTQYILPELLATYTRKHTNIQFHIHQGSSNDILNELINDRLSIGIVSSKNYEDALEFVPIKDDNIVLIMPNTAYYKNVMDNNIQQILLNEPIILRETSKNNIKNQDYLFDKLEINPRQLNIVARLNNLDVIIKLVSSGLGISLISKIAANSAIKNEAVLAVNISDNKPAKTLYLCYNKNYYLNNNISDFIKFIIHYYLKNND